MILYGIRRQRSRPPVVGFSSTYLNIIVGGVNGLQDEGRRFRITRAKKPVAGNGCTISRWAFISTVDSAASTQLAQVIEDLTANENHIGNDPTLSHLVFISIIDSATGTALDQVIDGLAASGIMMNVLHQTREFGTLAVLQQGGKDSIRT